jgi:outer membrane protein TolC
MESTGILRRGLFAAALVAVTAGVAAAQGAAQQPVSSAPVVLTLKRAVELALVNSKEIQVAKLQASLADRSALFTKAQFFPALYAGSGAGYTYGIPETPGGRAPSLFNVTYTQQIFNEPLRGQAKELREQAKGQQILLEDTRSKVIASTAAAYLELVVVRHSLDLLRKEQQSAEKILSVTRERESEALELPVEVTKAELTKARVVQRVLQLEGRQDELEVALRKETGIALESAIEVTPEDLPGPAETEGSNLLALAMEDNPSLRAAQSDVRAKEFRLQGEKRGNLPTIELVAIYSRLAHFNNYEDFFKKFQANNFNTGIQMQLPLFSTQTRAAVSLARVNLDVAKTVLADKQSQLSSEVRQRTRYLRERDALKEVARLELQLAQQNLAVLESQFTEGKVNLREVESARLEESDKWMSYLNANFLRQQAQLDLLRAAGQLDKVWQ